MGERSHHNAHRVAAMGKQRDMDIQEARGNNLEDQRQGADEEVVMVLRSAALMPAKVQHPQ